MQPFVSTSRTDVVNGALPSFGVSVGAMLSNAKSPRDLAGRSFGLGGSGGTVAGGGLDWSTTEPHTDSRAIQTWMASANIGKDIVTPVEIHGSSIWTDILWSWSWKEP